MTNEYNREEDLTKNYVDPNLDAKEETAAEIAAPINAIDRRDNDFRSEETVTGNGMGWLALALSIISLFVWPVVLGAAGIIIGFIARRRGAEGLGAWAIGIGIASIVIGIFIAPFF